MDFLTYASSLVDYKPDTGSMTWRAKNDNEKDAKRWNSRYSGKEVGTIDDKGYRRIVIRSFDGKARRIRVHQLAFFIAHKKKASGEIDHINQDKQDNRIDNLRDVPKSANQRNVAMKSNNTSGFTGVTWNKNRKKWEAFVGMNGKRKYLGLYENIQDAAKEVEIFRSNNGFTHRHGRAITRAAAEIGKQK